MSCHTVGSYPNRTTSIAAKLRCLQRHKLTLSSDSLGISYWLIWKCLGEQPLEVLRTWEDILMDRREEVRWMELALDRVH
jgi:hypothetical protein